MRQTTNHPQSLYLHLPFCRRKCHYCDFNSFSKIEELIPAYLIALEEEISRAGEAVAKDIQTRPEIQTIYIGGGTPSLLDGKQVWSVLAKCRSSFLIAKEVEITLEANPSTINKEQLESCREAGVNRLSIGVQSLDDELLRLMGRLHTAKEAIKAFELAQQADFSSLSIDLIYGLPRQSLTQWKDTLRKALELEPGHLSLYALHLEQSVPMARAVASGRLCSPDDDLAAEMYVVAEGKLEAAGYHHYEISNWAKPGHESDHNLTYWRNLPYLGLGAGAHSFWKGYRYANIKSPREYIAQMLREIERPGPADDLKPWTYGPVESIEEIPEELERAETIILGLRLVNGIEFSELSRRFGVDVFTIYASQIGDLESVGLLERNNNCLRLTKRGRLLGNEVFWRFLP